MRPAQTDRLPQNIEETPHVRFTQSRTTHRPAHRTTRFTTPIAKSTGAVCNLDCEYCFFLSKEML